MEKLLHTPEGVRDIYNVECGNEAGTGKSTEKNTAFIWIS